VDDDFDLAAEAGEEVRQVLDGEGVETVVGEGGDFGLVDAEMAGARVSERRREAKRARAISSRERRDEAAVLTAQADTFAGAKREGKGVGLLRSK
jgi:hypothetical protein